MAYTIAEIVQRRKVQDFLLVTSVILLGGISFGLGQLSVLEEQGERVALCDAPALQNTGVGNSLNTPTIGVSVNNTSAILGVSSTTQQETYVASKNGSVYHFPWCSGAQRIKEENKVWFRTKEEADRAGYRPASNCKGL